MFEKTQNAPEHMSNEILLKDVSVVVSLYLISSLASNKLRKRKILLMV